MVDSTEFAAQFQEDLKRNMERVQTLLDSFVANPSDPPVGSTPSQVVWRRGKARLLRYAPGRPRTNPLPYLIVPWLGISRPYVLDLLPGNSMIEYLANQGHDVYLLDWGEIAEEDRELGFEEAVFNIIPRAIEQVLETSGARDITLNGLCLGGTLGACYLALNPDAPVRNFVAVVAPIDFDQGGMFRVWLDQRHFPADLIVERYGGLPASLMGTGFKMLRPTLEAQAMAGLWANAQRPGYIESYKAMNRWANDFIGMPGRFFSQLAKDLYGSNRLVRGEFVLNGQTVDLKRIVQPLLVAAASQDYIVPSPAAEGLMNAVGSADKEFVELPGGHISVFSGRQAHQTLWPRINEWVLTHSAAPAA